MPCYYPLTGYRAKHKNESGKRSIVFNPKHGIQDEEVQVPCGQCIGCRLERSKQWAIRCVHEASMHQENSFITLTYNDENLPENGNLVKKDFQLFMKRLRKKTGKIKFYMCGEYGSQYDEQGEQITKTYIVNGKEKAIPVIGRPHFHACIFGFDFPDKELWTSRNGINLYRSQLLEELWPKGYSSVGAVTFESAAYVARYVTKKMTGEHQKIQCEQDGLRHYEKLTEDGEIVSLQPEYTTMSRGGKNKGSRGLGYDWFEQYGEHQIGNLDSIVIRGKEMQPPRYYTELFADIDEVLYDEIKEKRRESMLSRQHEQDIDRLRAKEKVKLAAITTLKREL
jgi:hypothetical protein